VLGRFDHRADTGREVHPQSGCGRGDSQHDRGTDQQRDVAAIVQQLRDDQWAEDLPDA
jgi:hypothetical protein